MPDLPPSDSTPENDPAIQKDRVSMREKVGLGLGNVVVEGSHATIHVLANSVYHVTMGLNPAALSTAVFIQRMWNAFIDPLVGQWSDNYRSKWGRRRPLMLLGAIPTAFFFATIWLFPADLGDTSLFLYFLVTSMAFYLGLSIYAVPFLGLQLAVTDDYKERTRVSATVHLIYFIFAISVQWFFPFTQLAVFGGTLAGLRWLAAILGALFLLSATFPIVALRERFYHKIVKSQARLPLRTSLAAVRKNKPAILLLASRGAVSFGFSLVSILGLYLNFYFIHHGDIRRAAIMQGWFGTGFQMASIGSTFLYRALAERVGKRLTIQIAASALIVGGIAKLLVYQPAHPWFQMVVYLTNGMAMSGMMLVGYSMLADVIDFDELTSTLRREAVFAAAYNWFDKIGYSVGTLISGYLLIASGFRLKMSGEQPAETFLKMKLLYAGLPVLGAIAAIIIISRYPLDEKWSVRTRVELAKRRAAAAEI